MCFDGPDDNWLPRTAPSDVGFTTARLAELVTEAENTNSDHLLLIVDDRILVERHWRPDEPTETQSLTKSIVALGILALVADGKISSLDVPLHTFFPEMAADARRAITLRHVLSHNTGLDASDGVNSAEDRLAYARSLRLQHRPGTRFRYNNAACQLLAGVVASASGEPLDAYVSQRILAPLGISDARWSKDKSGGPQAYFGLELTSRALAHIGLLLLHEGMWRNRRILPAHLIAAARSPSATSLSYGLLFWRRTGLRQTKEARARWPFLAPLAGRSFRTEDAYFRALRRLVSKDVTYGLVLAHPITMQLVEEVPDANMAFLGVGGLGQRLTIYPVRKTVAVRQHRRRPGDEQRERTIHWHGFEASVETTFPR